MKTKNKKCTLSSAIPCPTSHCDQCFHYKYEHVKINEPEQHKIYRQWAIDIVSDVPLGYLTDKDHTLLENYANRVCEALRTAPSNYKTHE